MSFIKELKDANLKDYGAVKVWEFGGSDSLDNALAEITGFYPSVNCWAINNKCDLMYIVNKGRARLHLVSDIKEITEIIRKGSVGFISKETYYKVEVLGKNPFHVWIPSSPKFDGSPECYRTDVPDEEISRLLK